MAEAARKLEVTPWHNAEALTPFEESFKQYSASEARRAEFEEALSIREKALQALAEKGWKPLVEGELRAKVDEARQEYDSLSGEEQAAYEADLVANHPDLFEAIQDSFEDDDTIQEEACRLIDAESGPRLAALEEAEGVINGAEMRALQRDLDGLHDQLTTNPDVSRIVPVGEDGEKFMPEDLPIAVGQ